MEIQKELQTDEFVNCSEFERFVRMTLAQNGLTFEAISTGENQMSIVVLDTKTLIDTNPDPDKKLPSNINGHLICIERPGIWDFILIGIVREDSLTESIFERLQDRGPKDN